MSPASYQTAPPRDVSFRCATAEPILGPGACCGTAWICSGTAYRHPTPGADTLISESERQLWPRRAGNGTRTRDPNLGKVVLYQLSYSRETERILVSGPPRRNDPRLGVNNGRRGSHGGEGDRTPDLVNAIHALSQLSYAPVTVFPPSNGAAAARKRSPRSSECQRGQRSPCDHSRSIEGHCGRIF